MLLFAAIASLDGYVNDTEGGFAWAAPDDEVHAFINELEASVSLCLYGRRMYDVMTFWAEPPADLSSVSTAYAEIWQAADKVVFSSSLPEVTTPRTSLERSWSAEVVRELTSSVRASIGGPTIAGQALRHGLVDEIHLFTVPVLVGGGVRVLPEGVSASLSLVDQRRFKSGFTYHRYDVQRAS